MNAFLRRPAQPSVAAVVALHEFEALDRAHAQIVDQLRQLERLVDRIDAGGVDDAARAMAASIVTFFDGSARAHHDEEERVVFPPLLAGSDTELIGHVRRLQQDHGWLEEDWRQLRPPLAAIAEGRTWFEPEVLRQGCEVFSALYIEHIALEESLVYPEARKRLEVQAEAVRRRTGMH